MFLYKSYLLIAAAFVGTAAPATLSAQQPFLGTAAWEALRSEADGGAAYENLRALTELHRVPATPQFDQAADFILHRAQEYGLADAHVERFPIDGKTRYGLMRSHLAWRVKSAQLWQLQPAHVLMADWSTDPIRLADYSRSAAVESELVDVGAGTAAADYVGHDVRGKLVLADGVLSAVQELAIAQYGAAGILSDMPNQTTAWSGLDPTLVRWGHLNARLARGFAFMISAATAADLRRQMAANIRVVLSARVQAEVGPGHWTIVTASIPGTQSTDPGAEIVYSCHLDHQRPGANDNGSGCVTILESARILERLIEAGGLPRPARSLRFIWGPEIEGTMAYLATHSEERRLMRADIHMDMVGGDPFKNKAILHVTQTPWSLPTFITDIGAAYAERIRDAAAAYAEGRGDAGAAVIESSSAAGSRNEFFVDETPFAEGSDHDDYDSSTIAVPSLYLRDWPDVYIHTDHDSLTQIDATKLRRVALLGAASGYTLASLDPADVAEVVPFFAVRGQQRMAKDFERARNLAQNSSLPPADAAYEAHNLMAQSLARETAVLISLARFATGPAGALDDSLAALQAQAALLQRWLEAPRHAADGASERRAVTGDSYADAPAWRTTAQARRVPQRIGAFGPLTYQNDDVLLDRLGPERIRAIQRLAADASRQLHVEDRGSLYAYEIVNFVDGKRSVADIRDAVAAELGPIPMEAVADYLAACEQAKLLRFR